MKLETLETRSAEASGTLEHRHSPEDCAWLLRSTGIVLLGDNSVKSIGPRLPDITSNVELSKPNLIMMLKAGTGVNLAGTPHEGKATWFAGEQSHAPQDWFLG